MNVMHYTPAASNRTRAAVNRLIGVRKFGHSFTQIGDCLCCRASWVSCPRTTPKDIWEGITAGYVREGWYTKGGALRAFYLTERRATDAWLAKDGYIV